MASSPRKRRQIAEDHPSSYVHIFANSPVDGTLYRKISAIVAKNQGAKAAVLTLVTYGGSPHDAYRIGRMLQMVYSQRLYVHVPTVCASAGTLLVCAANDLLISHMSELGPLDAQLLRADELHSRRSGLVVRSLFENLGLHAFELHTSLVERIIDHSGGTIKYRTAAHVAGEMVVGLMRGLYEQMNPEQIGEDYRFLKVAEEYGQRLIEHGGNISASSLKSLVYDFPSHDFIIDFKEAVRLFNNVAIPATQLTLRLADETKTPLQALSSRERIVDAWMVDGCPIYLESEKEIANDSPSEEPVGGSGSGSEGGVQSPLEEPGPRRENDASPNPRRRRDKRTPPPAG